METTVGQDIELVCEEANLLDDSPKLKAVTCGVLVVVALVSALALSGMFSSPDTYSSTLQSLDGKKDTALALAAASTAASAAISALPDDTCTPIAERLADLSGDFLVVLTAIYLEKYLLTTFGFATFAVIVPVSCALGILALLVRGRFGFRHSMMRLAFKLTLLGLALTLTVPASVLVSDMIESTYRESIDATMEAAQQTAQAAEEATKSDAEAEPEEASNPIVFFEQRLADVQNAAGAVVGGVTGIVNWLQDLVSNFIEALAVMIVVSCIIPLLVLVFFLWLVKLVLGLDVKTPMGKLRPRSLPHRG